ncbi:MAG: HEAT repeat domain-containing protein [Planctomycetota bacterium]
MKATDHEIWLQLLLEGGEFELVINRIMDRATLERTKQQNDEDAIRALVAEYRNADNSLDRRRALDAMSARHGEYVTPYLLPALEDEADGDWRVLAMAGLSRMGGVVVPALMEALDSDNPMLRRNVSFVLGNIGDPRAAGALAAVAATDADQNVAEAAADGAARCGLANAGGGLQALLRDGDAYYFRRDNVLAPYMYSDVVWSFEGGKLVPHPTPLSIYADELSKKAYYRAMRLAPDSLEAHAGVARASLDIQARINALVEAGEDVGELEAKAAEGSLAVAVAGPDALDLALQWSVMNDDSTTGTLLCNQLASTAKGPTAGLVNALEAADGAMRGEAAVALGRIAINTKQNADARVIDALGQNAGREVVRIAAIIDNDASRAAALTQALTGRGVMVNHRGNGAEGLAMLHRLPTVDVIIIGDTIGGMTTDAVLTHIAGQPTMAGKPMFFTTGSEELGEAYSDRVTGLLSDVSDLTPLDEAFSQRLDGDRAQADRLAAHSAQALSELAAAGHNIAPTLSALASTLAHRPDDVCVPAMNALALAGTSDQVQNLLAVLTEGGRSDEARIAAGNAIAGILGRHNVDGDAIDGLRSVFASDASLAVRQAAGRALGRFPLSAEERAELLRRVRQTVAGS